MYKNISKAFIVTLPMVFMAACSNIQPVQTVNNQPIPNGLSNKQIERSIEQAGAQRHWVISPVHPGLMVGNLNWRGYQASVNIPYTSHYYSIDYKDSYNLKYNNGRIHRGYNKWVSMLNSDIQTQLQIEKNNNLNKPVKTKAKK